MDFISLTEQSPWPNSGFCLLLLPLWESVIVLCFVVRYFISILVLQSSWWGRESWLLYLFVFLVSHDRCGALPHVAMGLSAVCDCGITWSYSFTIFTQTLYIVKLWYSKMLISFCDTDLIIKVIIQLIIKISHFCTLSSDQVGQFWQNLHKYIARS